MRLRLPGQGQAFIVEDGLQRILVRNKAVVGRRGRRLDAALGACRVGGLRRRFGWGGSGCRCCGGRCRWRLGLGCRRGAVLAFCGGTLLLDLTLVAVVQKKRA